MARRSSGPNPRGAERGTTSKTLALIERAVAAGTALRLFKEFVADVKEVETSAMRFQFTITTSDVDRDHDTIEAAGWQLENFFRSPSVLWAHDYSALPIAIARSIDVTPRGLISEADFTETAAVYPFAATVAALLRVGALRAASVGFRPIKWSYNEDRHGVDFTEQELLEYSIVPVPSNPYALIAARDGGIDVEPLREWAAKTLERLGDLTTGEQRIAEAVAAKVNAQLAESVRSYSMPGVVTDMRTTTAGDLSTTVSRTAKEEDDYPEGEDCPMDQGGKAAACVRCARRDALAGVKGVSPADASTARADVGESWSAPGLADFTADRWADLTATEQRHIAGHFAWAKAMPPERFEDLKLPHHRASDGAVVWRGVTASAARLGQSDIPESDLSAVRAHLARHYRAFDKTPPWESGENAITEPESAASAPAPDLTAAAVVLRVEPNMSDDFDLDAIENDDFDPETMSARELLSVCAEVTAELAAEHVRHAVNVARGRVD